MPPSDQRNAQFPINQIQSLEQRQNIHTSYRPYHNYNSNCWQATSVDNIKDENYSGLKIKQGLEENVQNIHQVVIEMEYST